MRIAPITFADALFVAERMRQIDKDEIYATRWNDSPVDVASDCINAGPFGWTAGVEDPIAVIGAAPLHPGVWGVYMFASDDFAKIAFSLTKFVKRVMIPSLVTAGAHRAECCSLKSHETAHRWLEHLGAKRESIRKGYGRGGEDFFQYVWDDPDVFRCP